MKTRFWSSGMWTQSTIDAFIARLALSELGFERAWAAGTGRPGYDPRVLLKLYAPLAYCLHPLHFQKLFSQKQPKNRMSSPKSL
jgi:hypothetical protein